MKGEKLKFITALHQMAGSEYKGEAIYPDIKFPGRNFHSVCCINIEILYPSDTEFPN